MTQDIREALAELVRAYVRLLETGRDRIISAGGYCDPVDVMERRDPALRAARAALAEQQATVAPAPGYCKHCKQYTIEEPLAEQPPKADDAFDTLPDDYEVN